MFEKSSKYISVVKTNTVEALINDIIQFINLENYCYIIEATEQSFTSGLYEINMSGAVEE